MSTPVSVTRSRLTTVAVLLSALIVAAAAQCKPPTGPTVQEYRGKSPTLALADKTGVLRIGVTKDYPLMSFYDEKSTVLPESLRWSGFDITIARLVASELGFPEPGNIQFVPTTTEERVLFLQEGSVDLVIADFTITPERREKIRFAGPYLVTRPEIMIRKADQGRITTIDDLKSLRVCTTGGSTTEKMLKENYKLNPTALTRGSDCAKGVADNIYDVHCTDEVVIAGFKERSPGTFEMVDLPFINTEPLGIGLRKDDPYLEALIVHWLKKQKVLGDKSQWQAAYNATLFRQLLPKQQPPPDGDYPELVDQEVKRG